MTGLGAFMKRIVDLIIATIALLILAPVMVGVAILIRINMGTPVLFRQVRPGYRERPFCLVKFRTMRDVLDSTGKPLPDGDRLTRFGRFLRSKSLDELPQLWNVLKGEMSLVGPRPLLMRYLPYFSDRERLRHTVRPGITGWAQIRGRNSASWSSRLSDDVWYVENWSLMLDLQIIVITFLIALRGSGVVVDPRSTMLNLDEERAIHAEQAS
jgi:sugar transferase EpsL